MEPVPVVNYGVRRTAEEMIAEYGPEALAEAKKQVQAASSEGFESLAKTWKLICAVIEDRDDSKTTTHDLFVSQRNHS